MTALRQKLFVRRTAPLALELKFFDKCNAPLDLTEYAGKLAFLPRKNATKELGAFSTVSSSDLGRVRRVENSLVAFVCTRFLHDFPFDRAFYEFRLLRGETNRLVLNGEIFVLDDTEAYSPDEDLDSLVINV